MIPITEKPINNNFNSADVEKKYIVIHDTGNQSGGANAEMHYRYFNSAYRGSSANYFVDKDSIIETVDPVTKYSWHCGDGRGKNGITNQNSIGIEICIPIDGNYEMAVSHTKDLVVCLMEVFNIPIENVVRHFDASGKICPRSMSDNGWARWDKFKKEVNQIVKEETKVDNWKEDAIMRLIDEGILTDYSWLGKADEDVPVWMLAIIVGRLLDRM